MITNQNPASTFTPSRWRRVFCSLFLIAAAVAAIGAFASSRLPAVAAYSVEAGAKAGSAEAGAGTRGSSPVSAAPARKIAPWVMEPTAHRQHTGVFVLLSHQ